MENHRPYKGPERRHRIRSNRFVAKYEQRRAERLRGEHHVLVRPFRISAGVLLLIITPFVGAIPGPGGVFVGLGGAFLLASEVRRAARIMDRIENVTIPRLRRFHARLRGGPKPQWVEDDPQLWSDWCTATGKALHRGGERDPRDEAIASTDPVSASSTIESEPDAARP